MTPRNINKTGPVKGNADGPSSKSRKGRSSAFGPRSKANDVPKANISKKRKKSPTRTQEATRKSARGAQRARPSRKQLLEYMLSQSAADLCRPEDEVRALKAQGGDEKVVTYTSGVLSPFQELVSAVVLSRPISHMLGLRTIRTIFNPPYDFTSAKKMQDAGLEKIHQALWDARTQHKAKTADQLSALADMVLELFTSDDDPEGKQLGHVLGNSDAEEELQKLTNKVKGLGPTGRDIFRRRIQWLWDAAYPFVDSRSAKALAELGIPWDAEDLRNFIHQHWGECGNDDVAGRDVKERKRRALVVVLERATGANLEGKIERIREEAVAQGNL